MIEAVNLTKKYGSLTAVSEISFIIDKKGVYGFLGPNGAGKSTTMNMITGCLAPTSGSVSVCGKDMLSSSVFAKSCIGYLPETPPLYTDMTAREFLSFVASAKRVKASEISSHIERIMKKTDILDVSDRLMKFLSKGYRQRVGIAMALIGDPEILIFDEPSVGLDPKQIIGIRRLIRSLGKDHTVILSSHILSEIEAVCDHIIIINNGEIVANAPLSDLRSSESFIVIEANCNRAECEKIIERTGGLKIVNESLQEGFTTYKISFEGERGSSETRATLFSAFASEGIPLLSLYEEKSTLESLFLSLTSSEAELSALEEYDEFDDDENEDDSYSSENENPSLLTLSELYERASRNRYDEGKGGGN